ncbi:MAG: hypothetical protein HC925_01530 [Coleofasciculaceae cyanobacterium SM2_3_26]|nr:hypothetical protein [Coleofasciculaceae cyanobacterium SM2_3_26]
MAEIAEKQTMMPAYLRLLGSGALVRRVELAQQYLKLCNLCPRHCLVNRYETTRGACLRHGRSRGGL